MELKGSKGHDMTFKRYHRYSDMLRYLEHLAAAHSDVVEVITIGKSSQGRPLKVVKVSSGGPHTKSGALKAAVWIDGGMHGREWIAPATVLFVLKQLVENYKTNRRLVDEADWYLMPVVNPDGYEYTHSTDRLWRKTRSSHDSGGFLSRTLSSFLFGSCEGVDLNRNFDYHWGEAGASDDPCADTYAGPRAFSEPESTAVAQFLLDHKDRVRLYLSLHSYAQMWLMPWGFTGRQPADHGDLYALGRRAVSALSSVAGTDYKLGSTQTMLYPTSGGSEDWAKGVAGIKYAYTVELPDQGEHGFMLPASRILPTGKETFAAIRALARAVVCKS
ncbi:carboxypeptidase B-like [Bacillus rossius redtenbacheri]|uniref:carboxypeptidase B-like n=1 Tax=Bacillus rossius redtenbacheri TaxID=93214 RepID=UPI002FDDF9D1